MFRTNNDPLDYLAVPKAGILVFADYIHDTFIAANSWAINSWNWLMGEIGLGGSTLVDIVKAGFVWFILLLLGLLILSIFK